MAHSHRQKPLTVDLPMLMSAFFKNIKSYVANFVCAACTKYQQRSVFY